MRVRGREGEEERRNKGGLKEAGFFFAHRKGQLASKATYYRHLYHIIVHGTAPTYIILY